MAAVLLVLGAVAIKERMEKKKAAKRMVDDLRYQELQANTERRLSLGRTESGGDVVIENGELEEGDGLGEMPPSYEQVVRTESALSGRSFDGPLPERTRTGVGKRRSAVKKMLKIG